VLILPLLTIGQASVVRDDGIDQYIRDILELLKAQMPNGIPELGIPPLEPFEVPHFDIPHIDETIFQADITIDNFVIKHLSTFETKLAHLDLEGLALELDLFIPDLRGDADYTIDGKFLGIVHVYGDGPMWIEIYDLDLMGKAAVLINPEGFLEVSEMNITATFGDIKMNLTNLEGGSNLGDSINNILNLMGGFIWDQLSGVILPILDNLLMDVLNDALDGCSIPDLIESGSCFRNGLRESIKNGHGIRDMLRESIKNDHGIRDRLRESIKNGHGPNPLNLNTKGNA